MRHEDILRKAIEAFRENTSINIFPKSPPNPPPETQKNLISDTIIEIKWQNQTFKYYVDIKSTFNRPMLGLLINKYEKKKQKVILIAQYINPNLAEDLKKQNIPFMDIAGNAFINDPPLLIFITGKKPEAQIQPHAAYPALNPSELQVIYILLCLPGIENRPYREIAEKAKVALGSVGLTMNKLQKTGFLIDHPTQKRRLIRKKELLDRWVVEYPQRLRPKLLLNRYRSDQKDWWEELDITKFNACWGGDVAAYFLTRHLRPHTLTVYTDRLNNEFVMKNKLIKDVQGNIEILEAFWNYPGLFRKKDLAHPVLVYSDLLAQADSRAVETARMIYEKEIVQLIRED